MEPANKTQLGTPLAPVTTTPAKSGEIARLLDELLNVSTVLQDNTNNLSEVLRPVLRNEPTETTPNKEYDTTTDLGGILSMVIARVAATNRVVIDTRNRLEI